MALSENGKQVLRRAVKDSTMAASIATKIDNPLSALTNREARQMRRVFGSLAVGTEIEGKIFVPSALEARTARIMRIVARGQATGDHMTTEIGS